MLLMVIGGSASGKSEYAEARAVAVDCKSEYAEARAAAAACKAENTELSGTGRKKY